MSRIFRNSIYYIILLENEDSTDNNEDIIFEKVNDFQYI